LPGSIWIMLEHWAASLAAPKTAAAMARLLAPFAPQQGWAVTALPGDLCGHEPRPFALHLALASAAMLSSKSGLPRSNDASPRSKPEPSPAWPDLPESLAAELARLSRLRSTAARPRRHRAAVIMRGMEAYRRHPYRPAAGG